MQVPFNFGISGAPIAFRAGGSARNLPIAAGSVEHVSINQWRHLHYGIRTGVFSNVHQSGAHTAVPEHAPVYRG